MTDVNNAKRDAGPDPAKAWLARAYAAASIQDVCDVEGARIAFHGWNLDRTDLPGIVLVHGFRAHRRWWDHVGPLLSDHHRVAALDLSGMGDSDRRASYSRAQHGREALGVAEVLGFRDPIVIAHSYGGVAVLTAARAQPGRLARAIILDSALPTPDDVANQAVVARPLKAYASLEAALERFVLLPPGEWPDPDVLAYIARHSARETADGWIWKFDGEGASTLNRDGRYRDDLLNVETSCDFIYGELSELVTPERLAEIPNVSASASGPIWIPASHHHVMIEQPLALVAALRALLARP